MLVVLVDNSYGPGGPGMVLAGVLVVLVDNSYGPGGPGVVLAGVLVVLVGNSYGPGGPWVVLAGLMVVLVDICMVPAVLGGPGLGSLLPPTARGANVVNHMNLTKAGRECDENHTS